MDGASLGGRRVAVGVGGGIAAYKSCELVRELQRSGAEVRVALTPGALQFVTALTFQSLSGQPVLTDSFDVSQEATFGHLELARWAELFIVCPATADLLARIRVGMGNDAVTTSLLAFRGKVLLAPAMNVAMYENPITQGNLLALLADSRFSVVGPGTGLLACGDVGSGRLSEPAEVVAAAAALMGQGPLSGKRVLITAGPTREPLDPVRFLSNPSTGKMGLALAHAARARGASVTVVLGPVSTVDRRGLEVIDVTTAQEMAAAVLARVADFDVFIAAAAVSDHQPAEASLQKMKKEEGVQTLNLVRTPDVLAEASKLVHGLAQRPLLVGFAAQTERLEEYALKKLVAKRLDFVVANEVGRAGSGFASDSNRVLLLSPTHERRELAGTKTEVAERLWDALSPYATRISGSSSLP